MEIKKIKRKTIEKKVKEEYTAAREFCSYNFGRYYKMMIDTDNGCIWSDVFLSENDWKVYHDDSIISLDGLGWTVDEKEVAYVSSAIRLLTEAGWTIET